MHRPILQRLLNLRNKHLDLLRLPVLDPDQQAQKCGFQQRVEIDPENTADLFLPQSALRRH